MKKQYNFPPKSHGRNSFLNEAKTLNRGIIWAMGLGATPEALT
jgi:hypothetical protein